MPLIRNPRGRVVAVSEQLYAEKITVKGWSAVAPAAPPFISRPKSDVRERPAPLPAARAGVADAPAAPPASTVAEFAGTLRGRPGLVLGLGPSAHELTGDDLARFRAAGGYVIAVNQAVGVCAPHVDAFVALDGRAIAACAAQIAAINCPAWIPERVPAPAGVKSVARFAMRPLTDGERHRIDLSDTALAPGYTSALPAIQLLLHGGCDAIYLAGIDLVPFADGTTYGAVKRDDRGTETRRAEFAKMRAGFAALADYLHDHPSVRIYRTSATSTLDMFGVRGIPAFSFGLWALSFELRAES